MAEPLTAEQIAERRSNMRAFRRLLEMTDDTEFNTTLLMQEEWLATVDELQGFVRDAHIIRGLRLLKCLGEREMECPTYWGTGLAHVKRLYCAPCYLRAIHEEREVPND